MTARDAKYVAAIMVATGFLCLVRACHGADALLNIKEPGGPEYTYHRFTHKVACDGGAAEENYLRRFPSGTVIRCDPPIEDKRDAKR